MCQVCWDHAECAVATGVAQCMLGSLGSCNMCWGRWDSTACAEVAGDVCSLCQSRLGHVVCARVAGIAQHIPGLLGSHSVCQGRWG